MSQENSQDKSDIVSSIFQRGGKKQPSSLFTQKGGKSTEVLSRKPLPPSFVAKKRYPLGLDIGSHSIKAIQLASDRAGDVKILHSVIEELPAATRQDKKEYARVISEILKNTLNSKGLKGDCYCAASAADVKIYLVKLPKMPPNEIENALSWEVQQLSQADMSEIVFDYIVLKDQESSLWGEQVGVLAITANKKDVFKHMALLESAGLNPLAIDIEPLADLAALQYGKPALQEACLLFLDFGAEKTALNIIYNNELLYTRALNVSGNSLTKAISDYCKVAWEEAEALKVEHGMSASGEVSSASGQDRASQARNAIIPLLENMVEDIDHTFKYFSYQVSQSQITTFDKVVLSGGAAAMKGLIPFLRNRLGVDIRVVDALAAFGATEELVSLSPRLHVALGLALRGLE